MARGPIHVAITFDDSFWAPAYATLRSVCLASLRRQDLVLFALHTGLKPEHRKAFDAIGAEFPVRLIHIDLDAYQPLRDFVGSLTVGFSYRPVIYARLMLPDLLPAEVDRVIYLDSDTMVRTPIEELTDLDLGGHPIAAVLDPHRHRAMLGRDFRRNADLFDYRQAYFNSGVMVIDRAAFAAADLPAKTRQYHEDGILERVQYDQAVLNLVFKDNWLPLDFRWNLINPQPAHENLEPKIVHYTGPNKPWHLLSRAAFAQAYRHTMTNEVFYAYWRERQLARLTAPFGRKGS